MSQTILITGASSGIGQATAKLFQANGWNVIATMRSPDKETELGELDNVLVARLDVTEPESISEAVASGLAAFGNIDVLVNNAGYGAFGVLEASSLEAIRLQFETNVFGPLASMKALLPQMRQRRAGTIINVTSLGGRVAFPIGSLYHGSKFAMEGVSEALAYELAAIGIRIKLVEPGVTQTDFGGRSVHFYQGENLDEYTPIVTQTMSTYARLGETASPASTVAETIFRAANDRSSRLRYPSGQDAQALLDDRAREDDDVFFARINDLFTLRSGKD